MREEAFLQPGDEHRVELEPLGRVHAHQLQRGPALVGLGVARLQRRVREECRQRIGVRLTRLAFDFADKTVGGVDEFLKVVDAFLPVLFRPVMRQQAAVVNDVFDDFGQF